MRKVQYTLRTGAYDLSVSSWKRVELAGIPVHVRYQPKWGFHVEGVLDETKTL